MLHRNGYTGVTIALSSRILGERLPDNFANIVAELVESASKKVYAELDGRAFFREITLLVPSSLNASAIVETNSTSGDFNIAVSSRPSFGSAHFVIEADKGVLFGEHPYTLQYGSCGVQGLRTVLPFSSVVKIDGVAMAKEWLRFRYGVFSEEPVLNDPLYSPAAAATKQGVLCESRSARDVINQSDDFSGVNLSGSSPYERVKLNIVQEAPLRLVVVWNVESKDRTSTPYMTTLKALKKFAQTLVPERSMMALVAYSSSVFYADSRLIVMNTKEQREQFAKSYPTSPRVTSTLERAVVKALELLDSKAGEQTGPQGSILLISHEQIRMEDLNAARKALGGKQLRVHALLFSKSGVENNVEKLCSEYNGGVFLAQTYEKRSLAYTQQTNAIAALAFSKTSYAQTMAPVILRQKVIDPVKEGAETTEVFNVDSLDMMTLGVDIVFENGEETSYHINDLFLESPTGKTYDIKSPELTELQAFHVGQFKIQGASSGQWTLRIKPETSMPNPVKLEIWLQTSSITDPPVTISAWLSSEFWNVDPSKPLLIYAEVRKGSNPIRYVSVTATVVDPDGNTTEFSLVDNGAGTPDVTAGDGIYSRYFTGFSKKGHYTLSVSAEASDQSVVVGGVMRNEESSPPAQCCGSQFPKQGSVPSGPFSRYFEYGSFFSIADRPQGDIYPPSRITDLKASRDGDRVTLEWTAPGNDYDHGTARSYEFRFFDRVVDFAKLFEDSGKIIQKFDIDNLANSPRPFGEREMCAFTFRHGDHGGSYYFAIRADDDSNKGPVSNVVEVTFSAPTTPAVVPGGEGTQDGIVNVTDNDRNFARGGLTSLQLALAIVLPLLFLVILIIIILLVVCFRRRGKDAKGSQDSSPPPPPTRARPIISAPLAQNGSVTPKKEESDDKVNPYATSLFNGSSISPINSYSADYLMDQYEHEKAKKAPQNGTRTPTAPQRADLSSSSDSHSDDQTRRPEKVWTSPQGRDLQDDVGLPAVKPYVTELRPVQSPSYEPGSRRLPPDFSSVPRRQTFV